MEKQTKFYIKQLLSNLHSYIVIIEFTKGSAGSLVHRIIGHDKSFYWDVEYNNFNSTDSLVFPKIDIKYDISSSITCHVSHSELQHINEKIIKSLILKAIKNNKKTILKDHLCITRSINKNIKIVRIVGNKKKLNRLKLQESHNHFLPNTYLTPILETNTYNLNINNLTSIDYNIFKKEYLALCADLKLTPDINPVRNFILEWVSRQ